MYMTTAPLFCMHLTPPKVTCRAKKRQRVQKWSQIWRTKWTDQRLHVHNLRIERICMLRLNKKYINSPCKSGDRKRIFKNLSGKYINQPAEPQGLEKFGASEINDARGRAHERDENMGRFRLKCRTLPRSRGTETFCLCRHVDVPTVKL
jgi:hypothetical protein